MERKAIQNRAEVYQRLSNIGDTLSEHDLLAYIEGNLSVQDTKTIEQIIFTEGNEFYLDILDELKMRFEKHNGDTQAIMDELDEQIAQVPFFNDDTCCPCQKNKLNDPLPLYKNRIDDLNNYIDTGFEDRIELIVERKINQAIKAKNQNWLDWLRNPLYNNSWFLKYMPKPQLLKMFRRMHS